MEPALLYMDGGVDLFTPATNPTGILDSMGVAHLLDEPGAAAELADFGRRRPLLGGDRLLLFGYTDYPGAEQDVLVRRGPPPPRRGRLHRPADRGYSAAQRGPDLRRGDDLPGRLRRHEGSAGLIITEFNPDHGAEDGSTADPLVRGLVGALTG